MALDARSRSSIYGKFLPWLGEEDTNALMSEFPSVESDELVTKQFLRAEMSDLRAEIFDARGELRVEISDVRGELRTEVSGLRTEMSERFRQQTMLLGSGLAGATALLATLTTLT